MRFQRLLLVALLGLGSGATLPGQAKNVPSGWGSHLGPQPPSSAPRGIDWSQQAELSAAHRGWQTWRRQHPQWQVLMDPRTGMPEFAYGPPIQVLSGSADAQEVSTGALGVARDIITSLGLDFSNYELARAQQAGNLWYVHFVQKFAGAVVWNANLTLRIDALGRLVMWGGRFVDTGSLVPEFVLSAAQARLSGISHLQGLGYSWATTRHRLHGVEPYVYVKETRVAFEPKLTWRVLLEADEPRADWVLFVNAQSGAIEEYWNDVRECGHPDPGAIGALLALADINGVVRGTTHEGLTPQQTPQSTNFPDIRVTVNGTQVTTNATGAYTFMGGPASVPVVSGLDGPWITGSSAQSPSANFSGNATTGTFDVVFTDTISTVAERDMVYFANKTHAFLKTYWPTNTAMDTPLTGVTNQTTGNCNASYSPLQYRINFFAAGGGCIATSTSSTVVEHEYGHGISIRSYPPGSSVPGHLGEGYSDVISSYIENTPFLGLGFFGAGTTVRNLSNTCQYPSSCGTAIHSRGLVIGGCMWDLKTRFEATLGSLGTTLVRQYALRHLAAGPQDEIVSLMELLLLDDNDGNLANGTPNVLSFHQAFTQNHGVPFPLPLISVESATPADSMDQLSPYIVEATASSITGNSVTSASLWWRVNSGNFLTVPMTATGSGGFSGSIPNQAGGNRVEYYVRVVDSQGTIGVGPAGAPTQLYAFNTGLVSTFFTDDFETPSGWTHAQVQTQDDWHNVVHGNTSHVYDPPSAHSGVLTWGNDLVPASNWNGNYGNNVNNYLQSPPIDCTGRTGVSLSYHRWLTVEDGLFDQASIQVSANNGPYSTRWQNAVSSGGGQNHIDSAWIHHVVDLSSVADNQPNVRLRFALTTDGGVTFGGWNVDTVRLQTLSNNAILTQTGSSQSGQVFNLHLNGASGDFVIVAASLVQATSHLAGLGTISLDLNAPLLFLFPVSANYGVTLPASGQFTLPFTVPPVTNLTVHFQGILLRGGDPNQPVITNVLSATFN